MKLRCLHWKGESGRRLRVGARLARPRPPFADASDAESCRVPCRLTFAHAPGRGRSKGRVAGWHGVFWNSVGRSPTSHSPPARRIRAKLSSWMLKACRHARWQAVKVHELASATLTATRRTMLSADVADAGADIEAAASKLKSTRWPLLRPLGARCHSPAPQTIGRREPSEPLAPQARARWRAGSAPAHRAA